MTCVSFYRELFPLFVGVWFTQLAPFSHLGPRAAVSVLTMANYAGGIGGGLATLALKDVERQGLLVVLSTMTYGVFCLLLGSTRYFLVAALAVFFCGAADAVGATMRGQVVLLTTPDRFLGRAFSGHSMAANVANSIGQVYVANMVEYVGAGNTMLLGGILTEACVLLAVVKIPALLSHTGLAMHGTEVASTDNSIGSKHGRGGVELATLPPASV
jgi:predicted MFS family arabinose efflux permease